MTQQQQILEKSRIFPQPLAEIKTTPLLMHACGTLYQPFWDKTLKTEELQSCPVWHKFVSDYISSNFVRILVGSKAPQSSFISSNSSPWWPRPALVRFSPRKSSTSSRIYTCRRLSPNTGPLATAHCWQSTMHCPDSAKWATGCCAWMGFTHAANYSPHGGFHFQPN